MWVDGTQKAVYSSQMWRQRRWRSCARHKIQSSHISSSLDGYSEPGWITALWGRITFSYGTNWQLLVTVWQIFLTLNTLTSAVDLDQRSHPGLFLIFRHCLYFLREQWMDLNGKMRWLVSEWVQRGLLGLGRGIRSLEELCWLGLGKVVKLIFIDIQWFGHDRLDLSGAFLACKTNSFPSMFYRQNICKKGNCAIVKLIIAHPVCRLRS